MRKTKKAQPQLTHALLLAKLRYNPETGSFTWLESKYKPALVGQEAGWDDSHGHIVIELFGKRYKAGRLAWFYMKGEWPDGEVDHRDRDPSNNRWGNLREATRTLNNVNRVRTRKYDLPRGVDHNKNGYLARIRVGGKTYCLGTYRTPEAAAAVYQREAIKVYGEFLPQ